MPSLTRIRAGQMGLKSRPEDFLFAIASKPALGPTMLLHSEYPELFLGVRPGRVGDNSPISSANVKNAQDNTSTSLYVCIHGEVLN